MSVFPFTAFLYISTEKIADQLHSVAYAEYGDAKVKDPLINSRRSLIVYTGRSAGQHNAPWVQLLYVPYGDAGRHNYRMYFAFPDAPGNELYIL